MFAGGQARRRHLVKERLEEVVVAAVDERHIDVLALELLDRFQPGEPSADDDDLRAVGRRPGHSVWWRPA